MVHDQPNHSQILEFLDIDLNSCISSTNPSQYLTSGASLTGGPPSASSQPSSFISSSNPNLVFTADLNDTITDFNNNKSNNHDQSNRAYDSEFGGYSIFDKDHSNDFSFSNNAPTTSSSSSPPPSQIASSIKPPGSKILPLLSNKSAPIRLTTSTSCSYLSEFYPLSFQPSPSTGGVHSYAQSSNKWPPGCGISSHSPPPSQHQQQQHQYSSSNANNSSSSMNCLTTLPSFVTEFPSSTTNTQSNSIIANQAESNDIVNVVEANNEPSSLFPMDDFNLAATPTDLDVVSNSQSVQAHHHHHQSLGLESLKPIELDHNTTSHSNQNNTDNSNHHHHHHNTTSNSSNNNNNTLYASNPGGFISRSNSQPDLTLSMDKLIPPHAANYHNYYYNTSCDSGNPNYTPSSHHYQMSIMTCSPGGSNMVSTSNSGKLLRRYPSLTFKPECFSNDSFEYLSNYNVNMNDCFGSGNVCSSSSGVLNGIGSGNSSVLNQFSPNAGPDTLMTGNNGMSVGNHHHHHHQGHHNHHTGFNAAPTYSATTSGVSSSSSLATASIDDGLLVGMETINEFLMNKNAESTTCSSSIFEGKMSRIIYLLEIVIIIKIIGLPDLEDLMSLVTFSGSTSTNNSSNNNHTVASRHSSAPESAIEATLMHHHHQHSVEHLSDMHYIKKSPRPQQQLNEMSFFDQNQSHNTANENNMHINSHYYDYEPIMANTNSHSGFQHTLNSENTSSETMMNIELVKGETISDCPVGMTGSMDPGCDNVDTMGGMGEEQRVSRSAPPSPTMAQKKKQRPATNLAW